MLLLTSSQWIAGPASFRPPAFLSGRSASIWTLEPNPLSHDHRRAAGIPSIRREVGLNYKFDWGGPIARRY